MSELEARLQRLEAQCAALADQVALLRTKAELSDLMGRYAVYYSADCGERIVEELWSRGEDVSLEYGASGIYDGNWKVRSFYVNEAVPGRMNTIAFSSPTILAGETEDTAWGCWTALGTQTDAGELGSATVAEESNRYALFSSTAADGRRYRAEVLAQRYEVVFRREADGWRIKDLHVSEYFRCPWGKDWAAFAGERFASDGVWLESLFETPLSFPPEAHGENLPSRATSTHWQYTVDGRPEPPAASFGGTIKKENDKI